MVFLNITSLRNKIIDLRLIVKWCKPDVFVIGETKLNASFKTETLSIDGYQNPYRKDRTEFGGGLMQYIRNGIVCKRVPCFVSPTIELICSELTICKKKWVVFSFYRPPDSNLESFFREIFKSVNAALDKYDNIIIMGDINIDTHDTKHPGYNELKSFCDVLGLSNLVTGKTCFSSQ